MRFHLSGIGLVVLLTGAALSGMFGNCMSAVAVSMAAVSWIAITKMRGRSVALGIGAVCGWLLLAAVIEACLRIRS